MKKKKIIAILAIVFVLAVVIVQNHGPVQAHFLFITVEMPVILLLVLTAALGFILGILAAFLDSSRTQEKK